MTQHHQQQNELFQIRQIVCTILSLVQSLFAAVSNIPSAVIAAVVAAAPTAVPFISSVVSGVVTTTPPPPYLATITFPLDGVTCNNVSSLINTFAQITNAPLQFFSGYNITSATFAVAGSPTQTFTVTPCTATGNCPGFVATADPGTTITTVPVGTRLYLTDTVINCLS